MSVAKVGGHNNTTRWQVVEERLGTSPDSADAERQFVWGLRYIDDLVLRDRDTERLYAMQDANWNVTGIADDMGAVQERYAYTAYGTPVFLSSAFVPHAAAFDWETLFCGYRYESGTGLFHVRNRVFHSVLAAWVQRDPLGLIAGTNLYEYCNSAPILSEDPLGLQNWRRMCIDACTLALGLACLAGSYYLTATCWMTWAPRCIKLRWAPLVIICGVVAVFACLYAFFTACDLCFTAAANLCQLVC